MLTVDLTNRCNMMCDPCFMDANQVGYVHELSWEEITQDPGRRGARCSPRRQMSIQFSGGEPTLSPHFLDAIRYAPKKGYFAVQCATNGIRFAEEPGFAQRRPRKRASAWRTSSSTASPTRRTATGRSAISTTSSCAPSRSCPAAGIDVILVVTIVNGVNNDQVGPIVEFAVQNADKITVVSFQPVSFTGRDEDISDELRAAAALHAEPPRPRHRARRPA